MDIVAARRFGKAQRETVRNVGKAFHHQRTTRQVIQTVVDHVQRGIDFVDTHFQTGNNVAALLAVDFHWQQAITNKRVIGAGIASVSAGADYACIRVYMQSGNLRETRRNAKGNLCTRQDVFLEYRHPQLHPKITSSGIRRRKTASTQAGNGALNSPTLNNTKSADTARRVAAGADERQLTFVAFAHVVRPDQMGGIVTALAVID